MKYTYHVLQYKWYENRYGCDETTTRQTTPTANRFYFHADDIDDRATQKRFDFGSMQQNPHTRNVHGMLLSTRTEPEPELKCK